MPLPPLYGHHDIRKRLAAAVSSGTLAQSLLVHGPAGTGKERLGLWVAQALVCEGEGGEQPCGACRPCRMAERLEHPDVHWFFPLPRPDAQTPEKLREKLEEARYAELAERRDDPAHIPEYEKTPAYFLGTIQNLQRLAGVRPAMGRRKVFVVGDAEAMVPQESSPEAANAFLKLLEEPPADTTLVLTSSTPGALLPTILSRVLPVRVLALPEDEVARFLAEVKELPPERAAEIAREAQGSIGRALRLLPGSGGTGTLSRRREAGKALLQAALADSPAARLAAAHAEAPAGARGEFTANLDALALWLRDLMAVAAGAPEHAVMAAERETLAALARRKSVSPQAVAAALLHVQEAKELAAGNVNPQLIVADLLRAIRRELVRAS
jgi:DNA polymerase-3 subunit delta'